MFKTVIKATSSAECCTIAVSIGFLWFLDLSANLSYQISNAHSILAKLHILIWSHLNRRECAPALLDCLALMVYGACRKHNQAVVERFEGRVFGRKADRNSASDVVGRIRSRPINLIVLVEGYPNRINGSCCNCARPRICAMRGGQDDYFLCIRVEKTTATTNAS